MKSLESVWEWAVVWQEEGQENVYRVWYWTVLRWMKVVWLCWLVSAERWSGQGPGSVLSEEWARADMRLEHRSMLPAFSEAEAATAVVQ